MPEIPYFFETPVPKYFRENDWFDCENMFKFVHWAFARCQNIPHKTVKYGREISFQPYEFMAGRLSSPKECFLSENIFRNQLLKLEKAGLLKKTTNSLTNKYSCYVWMTEAFCKNNNQQNNQLTTNRQPTDNHKSRIKNSRIKKDHHHPEPSSLPNEIPNTNNDDPDDDPGLIDDFSLQKEIMMNLGNENRNLANSAKAQPNVQPNAKKNNPIIPHNNNYIPIPYSKNKKNCKETKSEQTPTVSLDLIVKGEPTTITMPEQDYKSCIDTMRSHDALTKHMTYILENPKRLCDISDWPNAIKSWKPVNKAIAIRQSNEDLAKQLVNEYRIDGSYGSTCQLYHCRDKDVKGIVFTTIGPAASTEEIICYSNPEFQQKCDEQISNRRMKKRSA